MHRPIAISLSPNAERDDVMLSLRTLFSPGKWNDKEEVEVLEKEFASYFGGKYKALAVNSGRSAEYLILKALGIGKGDSVALQAFTCVAVPNSVIWLGAKPIYVDIEENYNLDLEDLKRKLTTKTRAIIVQHTFGIPVDVSAIREIARNKDVYIVEDCAHGLGAGINDRMVGTMGDVAFFSFGRDKAISSVFGGMILCSDMALFSKIKGLRDNLNESPTLWTLQQLFHPVAFSLILPLYNLGLGKIVLLLMQKAGFLSKAIFPEEKRGLRPSIFPAKMPGGLAILARNQLRKLKRFVEHRKDISALYFDTLRDTRLILPPDIKGASLLRFPVRHEMSQEFFKKAKEKKILLGDWYRQVVMPAASWQLVGYRGDCPVAERLAKTVVELPTYPSLTEKDALKVIGFLKKWTNTVRK